MQSDVGYTLDYEKWKVREYSISRHGLFVIIAFGDDRINRDIERLAEIFHLRQDERTWKENVKVGKNLSTSFNPSENFDLFIDDTVLKYKSKYEPSFIMCFFLLRGNQVSLGSSGHTFQLSRSEVFGVQASDSATSESLNSGVPVPDSQASRVQGSVSEVFDGQAFGVQDSDGEVFEGHVVFDIQASDRQASDRQASDSPISDHQASDSDAADIQAAMSGCSSECKEQDHTYYGECQYRNYYNSIIFKISDHFPTIPKIFVMEVCRQSKFAPLRPDVEPSTKPQHAKSKKHVPEDSDGYIIYPCAHNIPQSIEHRVQSVLINALEKICRNIDINGFPKKLPPNAEAVHDGWMEDIGLKVRSIASIKKAQIGAEMYTPECINTLRAQLSFLKILHKQRSLTGPIKTPGILDKLKDFFTSRGN